MATNATIDATPRLTPTKVNAVRVFLRQRFLKIIYLDQ